MKFFDLAVGLAVGFCVGLLCRDLQRLAAHYWPRRSELVAAFRRQGRQRAATLGPQPSKPVVCGALPQLGDGLCGQPLTKIACGESHTDYRCGDGHGWRWWGKYGPLHRENSWQRWPDLDLPQISRQAVVR